MAEPNQTHNNRVIINLILEESQLERRQFEELKLLLGFSKPNTEIIRACIRSTYKQLLS